MTDAVRPPSRAPKSLRRAAAGARSRWRSRSAALVLIFYVLTIVKMGPAIFDRAL